MGGIRGLMGGSVAWSSGLLAESYLTRPVIHLRRSPFDPFSTNDKPVRGSPDEVEGMTRYKRQDLPAGRIQNLDVLWPHDIGEHHPVAIFASQCRKSDHVAGLN